MCLVLGLTLMANVGCSAVMAAKQPGKKDLSVLDAGTPRSHVIAELGAPVWAGERDSNKVDVFAFRQGYSKGARAGRAFFHAAADVFTLGLWEVVGTPIESVASGTDVKAEVTYDEDDRVKSTEIIEQEKAEASAETEETNLQEEDPATAAW
jgi:hypothetical protein